MKSENPEDSTMPLVAHLKELRDRMMRSIAVVFVVFIGLYFLAGDLYMILVKPLEVLLPESGQLIATGVTSPFFVPLKLTIVLAVFISVPYLLHQIWGFIAPALYKHERRVAIPLFISSVLLFYAGVSFVYFVVLPLVFGFFTSVGPENINLMPDIGNVLDFCLKLFFAFGIAFEIPIATFLLVRAGIVSVEALSSKRPYIFAGCFVIGMLLTPPDVISQTILAVPMWLLFELGLAFARLIPKAKIEEAENLD